MKVGTFHICIPYYIYIYMETALIPSYVLIPLIIFLPDISLVLQHSKKKKHIDKFWSDSSLL